MSIVLKVSLIFFMFIGFSGAARIKMPSLLEGKGISSDWSSAQLYKNCLKLSDSFRLAFMIDKLHGQIPMNEAVWDGNGTVDYTKLLATIKSHLETIQKGPSPKKDNGYNYAYYNLNKNYPHLIANLKVKVVDEGSKCRVKDVLKDTLNCAIKIRQLESKGNMEDANNWADLEKKFEGNLLNICKKIIANNPK